MKVVVAFLASLVIVLFLTIWELESRSPEIVRVEIEPPVEIPWIIFIQHCGELLMTLVTTDPLQWHLPGTVVPDESWNAAVRAYQLQVVDTSGPGECGLEPTAERT